MKNKITLFVVCVLITGLLCLSGCYKGNTNQNISSKPTPAAASTKDKAVDYALSKHWQAWTHHPVFGDASFDNFKRLPGNPVVRGVDGFEWPVNGTLFKDPVSGDWFLYAGWYAQRYAMDEQRRPHFSVYRSNDKGKTWQDCGEPLEGAGTHIFTGSTEPFWGAPDAAVCYKNGRYHMSFDWATKACTMRNIRSKDDPAINSGAAYAVADSPVGPFEPVVAYAQTRQIDSLYGKYDRPYASTLLPRKNDWIALTSVDSELCFGWGLACQTAPHPEGPWTEPNLLLHPELDWYYPQTLEFFPQFIHDGYIYAPVTSLAANHNYQAVFRAPIEKATDSDTWELFQDGSVWHNEPVDWEYEGIWGQTFSGFVDEDGMFYVMFPSRDSQNRGTINLACRPWDKPLRDRGFVISGHPTPSMSVLKHDTNLQKLNAELTILGTVQIIWGHDGPFGAHKIGHGTVLHRLMRTQYDALELTKDSWKLIKYDQQGNRTEIASGQVAGADGKYAVGIQTDGENLALKLNGQNCWQGLFKSNEGRIGVWVEKRSHTEVTKFEIQGDTSDTSMDFLYTEALQCAAQNMKDWEIIKEDNKFRYGEGAISKSDGLEVKWNFIGDGFALWAPTGPDFGKGELWLDGKKLAMIDFYSEKEQASHILYIDRKIPYNRYGLKLKITEGSIPVDILEAYTR